MREASVGLGLGLMVLGVLGAAPPAQARKAAAPRPVVVELFTAQGCAACPDANRRMGELAQRDDVLPLTFSVDYWDYLGWKDTFAQPAFGDRQRAYVGRLKVREIYTPEVVVDGRMEAAGVAADKVEGLIDRMGEPGAARPKIAFQRRGTRVRVGAASAKGATADVWLVRYDPRERVVKVRGDDRRTTPVSHFNVVRQLARLGTWRGQARTYAMAPAETPGLRTVVLVQGARGGRILAVGQAGGQAGAQPGGQAGGQAGQASNPG